ncbi:YheC/YheD family protein [Paenibacillus phoenicis]|uniref:YheC/YheD family protein n=1 Tax=Paenibacillus phoenicis TaxID=554117 RepID=A0ABU5PPF4_9BACL|nr:YheC/YheD family protein [Paenibacillus phoenicis]MEA3571814.1 YheC/YheD family protein [Paenibacillus phoenicis]
MTIQRIASKWEKTKVIYQKESLRPYIPDTRKYSFEHLRDMLEEYDYVFVKPDHGTYGIGVMSIEKWTDDLSPGSPLQYKLRYGIEYELYPTIEELHDALVAKMGSKPYLIQKGIRLLTYRRRRFDIRALVQQTPRKSWETTGFIGRIAAQQKVITNYHGGGSVMLIEDLLSSYMTPKEFAEKYKEMKSIGVQAAIQLARKFPQLKEIGLDIAIDEQYQIWILEINTKPALFPFKILHPKEVYQKIRRYAIAYGRLKAKSAKAK